MSTGAVQEETVFSEKHNRMDVARNEPWNLTKDINRRSSSFSRNPSEVLNFYGAYGNDMPWM